MAKHRLTVQQAITAYVAKMEGKEVMDGRLSPQVFNDEQRQWITAMREYIDRGVEGLTVSDSDMDGWRLEGSGPQGQGPSYRFTWHLSGGKVWAQSALSIDDLTPPGFAFWWSGYNDHVGQAFSFTSLVAALTYAQTGRAFRLAGQAWLGAAGQRSARLG